MPKYKITDISLNNIATAIKNKTHTTDSLVYPTGFVNTLNNIELGYDTYGFIDITYPAGSNCTAVSSDGVEFNAPDTSGRWILKVPEPATLEATWTVSCSDGENSDSKEVVISNEIRKQEVELVYIPENINDASWELISQIAQAGTGDNYWDVGDCKEIVLNGTIGNLSLSNYTTYVFILDFNHPINKNMADNNIIFGGFKSTLTGEKDIALCDSKYNSNPGSRYFSMNHASNTNVNGWKGCDLRYDVLGATSSKNSNATQTTITSPINSTLMAALPSDMRAVLRLWTHYVDNVGNKSNIDNNVTSVVDAGITLLAEYEVFGVRTYANQYEQNHQKQMEYYITGNSKIKYNYSATSTAIYMWESSAYYNSTSGFGAIDVNGDSSAINFAGYSYGLAPAFKV